MTSYLCPELVASYLCPELMASYLCLELMASYLCPELMASYLCPELPDHEETHARLASQQFPPERIEKSHLFHMEVNFHTVSKKQF